MILDSHVHVWDPATRDHGWLRGLGPLDAAFGVDDLVVVAEPEGVGAAILVQVLADENETREFLRLAAATPFIAGVVGWVDLTASDVAARIAALREAPGGDRLVGLRHLVQSEPDPGWLMRPDVLAGLGAVADAGLVFDLLVVPAQLPAALAALRRVENLAAVLDHAAKPVVSAGAVAPWTSLLAEMAATGRVACKLSGLVSEAGPGFSAAMLQPFADHLLSSFGPSGVLFGSDWPVSAAVAPYASVVALARELIDQCSAAEQQAIFAGNAARTYQVGLSG